MLHISADLLEMSGEAAVIVRGGKIDFANAGAQSLLGSDCIGKTLSQCFGKELAGVQAPSFIGDFPVAGKHYVLRSCAVEGAKAIFFSPAAPKPDFLSEAFILSLRNCLMNLNMGLSMLQNRDELPDDVKAALAQLSHERYKIKRVLQNISLIHGNYMGRDSFSPVKLDISEHLHDTVHSLRALSPGADIRFSSPGPIQLYADPALLDVLLLNLISNCLCHAAGCTHINIGLHQHKEKVILSVDDNGCGIPANQLYSVFDRYCHNFGLQDINRGAGLGLSAARIIAELHGGTLMLESREAQGTAVRASFSTDANFAKLQSNEYVYDKNVDILLTGLANCLPPEAFSEIFSD